MHFSCSACKCTCTLGEFVHLQSVEKERRFEDLKRQLSVVNAEKTQLDGESLVWLCPKTKEAME